jgi:catechol 2,3-dioxygenase-like lactoylglutathione lyase family enzyme
MRVRQLVLAVEDLEAARAEVEDAFALEECYRDPGVAKYDLVNVLFPVGEDFLELVSPTSTNAPAARYLARVGSEGGYMVIVQVDDFDAAAARAETAGVRIVERAERENQRGWHIHPADLPGAIVSFDWADPPEAWHWAGESWREHVRTSVTRGFAAAVISASEPDRLAARWHDVLGGELDGRVLRLGENAVRFERWDEPYARLTGIELEAADATDRGSSRRVRGIDFALV